MTPGTSRSVEESDITETDVEVMIDESMISSQSLTYIFPIENQQQHTFNVFLKNP